VNDMHKQAASSETTSQEKDNYCGISK